MRSLPFNFAIAVTLVLPLAGCASDTDAAPLHGDDVEVEELPGKADGIDQPIGTHEVLEHTATRRLDLVKLVLKTDGRYYGELALDPVACRASPPCDPFPIFGLYKLTRSTTSNERFLRLRVIEHEIGYEYEMDDGVVRLRALESTAWFTMRKASQPWCKAPSDCALQHLGQPACGDWGCEANTCQRTDC